jgi:diguanylate cyclase (GGDEF)-like protein
MLSMVGAAMPETADSADRTEMARTRAGVRGLALLNAQADALRKHLKQLRERLVETQLEVNANQAALVVQANEQLVLAALRADSIAEAAQSNFDDLASSARRDGLTGMPNRGLMLDRMQAIIARAGRRELNFAVLFIDLDNFKQINDTLGHAAGDGVLKVVAHRLEAAVRETDTVSRHGGDEFVVLLAELSPGIDTRAVVSKLLQEVQSPIETGADQISVSASIGVSLFPTDGRDAQTLIALADAAMYVAKREGGGRCIFQQDLGARASPGANWAGDRREALARSAHGGEGAPALPQRGRPAIPLHPDHLAFLAMVAHELRNPLTPLRHAATLLSRADTKEAVLQKLQGVIVRQVSRMVRLIDDLLHVSSEGVGKFCLQYADVDLGEVMATVLEACQPNIEGRRQKIEVTLPEAWPPMRGDAVRLAQVFGNLLDNASRYTPEGGQLALTVTVQPQEIEVVVSDTGVGISAGALQHIFELFVQENRTTSLRSDGLGIGLAVVRELVQRHGGTVTARSEGHNRGSSFIVRLPMGHAAVSLAACGEAGHSHIAPAAVELDRLHSNDLVRPRY